MAAPIYVVSYAGTQLPGYVQSDDRPLSFGSSVDRIFGREGAKVTPTGTGMRQISLTFLIKSTLTTYSSGLAHLDNLMDQYRSAVAAVSRPYGENALVIHNSDRYYMASVDSISMPMSAEQSRSMQYSVTFNAQPWAIATVAQTASFSGNGTVNITGMTGSRRTYPIFTVPATVTAFTATDSYGHTINFVRGLFTSIVAIDCGSMLVYRPANGDNRITTMQDLNFGMYYEPAGDTFSFTVSGFSGSGSISVAIPKRYEV